SSRPVHSPRAMPARQLKRCEQLRRKRWPLWRIAAAQHCGLATLSRKMRPLGLSRLSSLEPVQPIVRYERESPGELLHLDTKRLGRIDGVGHRITGRRRRRRGIGWEFVHLAIDDHSRVAFASVLDDEAANSCCAFLRDAITFYAD